jgi:hypothetical protein
LTNIKRHSAQNTTITVYFGGARVAGEPPWSDQRGEKSVRRFSSTLAASWIAIMGFVLPGLAAEYEIGNAQTVHGMKIAAVYLQPVEMEPAGMMRGASGRTSISRLIFMRRRTTRMDSPTLPGFLPLDWL